MDASEREFQLAKLRYLARVKAARTKGWCKVSDKVLDGYAKRLGYVIHQVRDGHGDKFTGFNERGQTLFENVNRQMCYDLLMDELGRRGQLLKGVAIEEDSSWTATRI